MTLLPAPLLRSASELFLLTTPQTSGLLDPECPQATLGIVTKGGTCEAQLKC